MTHHSSRRSESSLRTGLALVLLLPTLASAGDLNFEASASGEENEADGEMYLTSSDLELDYDPDWDQIVAIQFDDVPIASDGLFGAVYLQMTAAEDGSGPTDLTIWAQNSGDPAALASTDYDISDRPVTTASVSWTVAAWTEDDRGSAQRSPDLSALIAEVLAQPDWASGHKIVLIIDGDGAGDRNAVSANGSAADRPELVIEDATAELTVNFFNDLNGDGVIDPGEQELYGYAELLDIDGSDVGFDLIDPTPGSWEVPNGSQYGLDIGGWSPQWQYYLNLNPYVLVSTPSGYIGEFTPLPTINGDTSANVGFVIPTNYQTAPTTAEDTCYLVFDRFFDGSTYGPTDTAVQVDLDAGLVQSQTQLGDIGATGVTNIESAEYNTRTDQLYAADADELGEIDTTTGVYSSIAYFGWLDVDGGTSNVEIDDVDGMAYDPVNDLWYGFDRVSVGPDRMFVFDPSRAPSALLVKGHFGGADYVEVTPPSGDPTLIDVDDAAFDPRTGKMYAISNWGGSPTRIVEVDVTTGDTVDRGQVFFDPDGAGPIGPTPVVDAEGLGASATGALYITTGSTSYLFEIEVGASTVDATLMARILGGDQLSDIESLACNTRPVVEVGGVVWDDVDGNGTRDPGDDGIAGVQIQLVAPDDSVAAVTTTDADGTFLFGGLAAGFAYTVRVGADNLEAGGVLEGYQLTADSDPPENGAATSIVLNGTTETSDTSASFGYTFVPPGTCSDGILNQDETQIDCGGIVCAACLTFGMHPDKSKIKFGRKPGKLDYLMVQGGFELASYDPTVCDFTISITNANGAVTSFAVAAGELQQKGKCAVYSDKAARKAGGTQRVQVCAMREVDRWRFNLKGFGEFSAQATLADMNLRLDTCSDSFARGTTWNEKRNGWILPRSTWMP